MELRQLRYFVAVARHGSFTRAALALRLAQPALSQQIRRLERELGADLLVRGPRGTRLTDAGRVLLRRATRLEAELDGLQAELAQLSGALSGHVRIGVTVLPSQFGLPALLAEFRRDRPAISLLLRSGTAETMVRMLDADELDLAFATSTPEALRQGMASELMFREDIVALLPRDHRLADRHQVPLAALVDEPLIAPEPGAAVRDLLDRALAAGGLPRAIPFETNDPEMMRALAASRLAIAIGPRAMIEPIDPDFTAIAINPPRLRRDVALLWREDRQSSPAAEALHAFILENRPEPENGS